MNIKGLDWLRFRKATTGPHWRQEWALSISPGMPDSDADPLVQQLRNYWREYQQDPAGAAARQPLLAAVELLQQNAPLAEGLQLLVLANATMAQITERTGLPEEVTSLWQALYFDIGEFRAASFWMHSIIQRARQTNPRQASRMRFVCGGGLAALDDLLLAETKTPVVEADQHRSRRLRLLMGCDEAIDQLSGSPTQHLAAVKLMQQMLAADRRLASEPRVRAAAPGRNLPTAGLTHLHSAATDRQLAKPDGLEPASIESLGTPAIDTPNVVPFEQPPPVHDFGLDDDGLRRSA